MNHALFSESKSRLYQRKLPLRRTVDRAFRKIQRAALQRRARLLSRVGLREPGLHERSHKRVHRKSPPLRLTEDLYLIFLIFFLLIFDPHLFFVLSLLYLFLNLNTKAAITIQSNGFQKHVFEHDSARNLPG